MSPYRRGYRAELALVKLLKQREEFHTVIRSAGSRSPFDVIAIGQSRILLCQVKTGTGRFKNELQKLRHLSVPRSARKQLCLYRGKVWETFEIA
jgi:Holliday junction resolvase